MIIGDDRLIDGDQTAWITASVSGWTPASAPITIQDDELRQLTIAVSELFENQGSVIGKGIVTLPGIATKAIKIDFSMHSPSEISVPHTVKILPGTDSILFDLTVSDDMVIWSSISRHKER